MKEGKGFPAQHPPPENHADWNHPENFYFSGEEEKQFDELNSKEDISGDEDPVQWPPEAASRHKILQEIKVGSTCISFIITDTLQE